jgi:hypothetical protein
MVIMKGGKLFIIGHVWMEVLVLVCSKLTPKTNTLEPNACVRLVLVETNTPKN